MRWESPEDVPPEFGPPVDNATSNAARTRYVPWTSWAAAATLWPNAGGGSSTQGESSGMGVYAHELSHLLIIADNYNNPYSDPPQRAYTGPWSMMSRGSFNGPGGPHTRWQVPALQGAALGSLHTVRDKLQLGLTDENEVRILSRADLIASGGFLVADITARSVNPGPGELIGLRISLGADGGDRTPACNATATPFCDGGPYDHYEVEVVDRMGADSFQSDAGVPALQGAALGSLHTVRDKLQLGLTDENEVRILSRADLIASGGFLVADITARSVSPGPGELIGLRISLGADGGDRTPACNATATPFCDGGPYDHYEVEVVDRMGADSFQSDAGVMFSKTKTRDRLPFQWTIDANPQDIRLVDFIRPDGTPQYVTIGDYRQLADALFHAGTRSGSKAEHVDAANGLHFYVVEKKRSEAGVLSYTVAVRATAAGDAGRRDVEVGRGLVTDLRHNKPTEKGVTCSFEVTNTGEGADVFRLEAQVEGQGWRVAVPNELLVVEEGKVGIAKVAVVDRMGADSFQSDAGVMFSKTKTRDRLPFQWTIDANPQDIRLVDFVRPDGTPQYVTIGDYRQLADALFHAGTRSGSKAEHVDAANGLHFYVVEKKRSEAGVLSYTVAVRATAAGDAGRRDVEVGRGLVTDLRHNKPTEKGVTCSFEVTNTGEGADVFRLEAQVEGQGWRVAVPNELLVVEEGKVGIAKVAVGAVADAAGEGVVTLKVTSERGDAEDAGECRVTRAS
ncbi:hypothetical protein BN1708_013036 [Verticillium longisporum]|uniref:Peptidase M6-like domain-containing protein n=1 Tax=Verticillium longisporum TaxID=100787 RepID=A0A0G4LGP9_VERLO|nr:hypothetical protein BN1708_013036 [Verticillium longisporum]